MDSREPAPNGRVATVAPRLLMIDDESGFRNFVGRVAEAAGFEAFVTADATTFRERMRRWEPAVIVIDLNMPEVDGVELLRDLAEARATARVLIASGADAKVLSVVEALAEEHGLAIAGTVNKPVRAADLKAKLVELRETAPKARRDQAPPVAVDDLAEAIANDRLILHYQPQLDLGLQRIVGVEALVRWQHPEWGLVPPDRFIPVAEESGFIGALTRWACRTAVRQAAAWRRQGITLDVSVNLSAHDLRALDLPDWIEAACKEAVLPVHAVTLEVTESAATSDPARTKDVVTRLRLKGFCLSIDDFGTGYSSLIQLRQLPYSELKVDKSFVAQMLRDADSRAIVEEVVALGRKLGLRVVAEGVDSAAALEALRELGAGLAQGYFISRPVEAGRIAELVSSGGVPLATVVRMDGTT